MNMTPQQQKSFEKLQAVCPEITITESVRVKNSDIITCGNFAPAYDGRVHVHEDGEFIFWTTWEDYQIHQLRGES